MINYRYPDKPSDGQIFELEPGIIYQYDAKMRTWNELLSETKILELATIYRNGAMSALDFKKLNRLVYPFPRSTIIGQHCASSFSSGFLELRSDRFIEIHGDVTYVTPLLKSTSEPYKIQENTYGFDFEFRKDILLSYLQSYGRLNLTGKVGDRGQQGDPGIPGENTILSGPQGTKGAMGAAPLTKLALASERFIVSQNPNSKLIITDIEIVDDPTKLNNYSILLTRKSLGKIDSSASDFFVTRNESPLILVTDGVAVGDATNIATNVAANSSIEFTGCLNGDRKSVV